MTSILNFSTKKESVNPTITITNNISKLNKITEEKEEKEKKKRYVNWTPEIEVSYPPKLEEKFNTSFKEREQEACEEIDYGVLNTFLLSLILEYEKDTLKKYILTKNEYITLISILTGYSKTEIDIEVKENDNCLSSSRIKEIINIDLRKSEKKIINFKNSFYDRWRVLQSLPFDMSKIEF